MQILNIGIGEIILVLLIMLIVLGPERMISSARQVGRFVHRLTKSPVWANLMDTSREIRELPTRIVREAGMEEAIKEIQGQTEHVTELANRQLAQAGQSIEAADKELRSAAKVNARQPVPVSSENKPADSERLEPEKVTDSTAENSDGASELPGENALAEMEERTIAPPAMNETGEEVSVANDGIPPKSKTG
jgi:sec-independent protein translocase protein TatB